MRALPLAVRGEYSCVIIKVYPGIYLVPPLADLWYEYTSIEVMYVYEYRLAWSYRPTETRYRTMVATAVRATVREELKTREAVEGIRLTAV